MVTLPYYLMISAILFLLGLFAILCRRNAIAVLMGIELIINACGINLVAFNYFLKQTAHPLSGQIFTIFVIVVAAAEAAVALAIILTIYQHYRKIDVMELESLKH